MVRGNRCSKKKQPTKSKCKNSKHQTGISFNQTFDLYRNANTKPKLKIGKIEIDDTPDPKKETGYKIMKAGKILGGLAATAMAAHKLGFWKGRKEGENQMPLFKKWELPYDEKFVPVDMEINDKIDTLKQQLEYSPYLVNPFNIQEVVEDVSDKIKSINLFKGRAFKKDIQDHVNYYCNNFDKIMDQLRNGNGIANNHLQALSNLLESARNGYNTILEQSSKSNPDPINNINNNFNSTLNNNFNNSRNINLNNTRGAKIKS